MSALHSDNLLLFAWDLAWLLLLSVLLIFVLICRKHYQRNQRYRKMAEIECLLDSLKDPELFAAKQIEFHRRLRYFYENNYLDLLYAWTRKCQALTGIDREIYCNNAARCGLLDKIPENLNDKSPAKVCIALEVSGLAKLAQFTSLVEQFSWEPVYAPFACHALVRMDYSEGMRSVFRAYGHKLLNNSEVLAISSEYTQAQIVEWARETGHWPLPLVLTTYWVCS